VCPFFLAWQSKDGTQKDREGEAVRKIQEKKEGQRAARDRLSREMEFWEIQKGTSEV